MSKPKFEERIARWEARRRMDLALKSVEAAQNCLRQACERLSALTPLCADHERVGKLYDKVKLEWHRLNRVRNGDQFTLDAEDVFEESCPVEVRQQLGLAYYRGPKK